VNTISFDRRIFLAGVLATAATGIALTRNGDDRQDPGSPTVLEPGELVPFDATGFGPELIEFGRLVNKAAPDAVAAAHETLRRSSPAARRDALAAASISDVESDRMCQVGGWHLPQHLAGLAGLAALHRS